ncbi:MAG: mechanosensitive ion channel family protein [Phaeodactylibacter sp.]|uniref:mechanosensitive ion channel family protein n=1 Tax=Phaeodactylibacter sp. TaxID=1940289 RepID=UPI0032EAE5D7
MTQNIWIYIALVATGGGLFLFGTLKVITGYKKRKLKRLGEIQTLNPIKTVSPPGDSQEASLERAADNISGRFSIIRKGTIAFSILVIVLIGLLPFSTKLPITSISLLISAFGIVLGIAARPIIENFISGILLSFSSAIRLGDTVIINGYYGTVEDISMLHTTVKTWDWKRYIIANSDMLKREVVNYSVHDTFIWAHVEFFVSTEAEIADVRYTALRIAEQYNAAQVKEQPRFWVMAMGETAIKCWIAAWANSPANAWALQHNIRTDLVVALQEMGIQTHLNQHQLQSDQFIAAKG